METVPTQKQSVQQMSDFVMAIAKLLADTPEQVRVESQEMNDGTAFHLVVAEDDLGKLIGKGGRTARSLRTILSAAASKTGQRFKLDVESDESDE